jgi:hypothetical protein
MLKKCIAMEWMNDYHEQLDKPCLGMIAVDSKVISILPL